ncbi:MAG: CCA tRNA nucleotidyltransferase [Nanoarchaeota archaeon]|nr:CCA tRNA nucleotidyltransferase [Nanoarchaeota archaeon]
MHYLPTPTEEKHLQTTVKTIIQQINIPGATAKLGGSGAKGTWLAGTHDLDIYIIFNYKKYAPQTTQLADITEQHLKKHFKLERLHGSRDYFQTTYNGYTIEFIPILNITTAKQAKNITDISQLHVTYVNKHQKLKQDIRTAKAFMKAAGIYGAESYIQGFSGYLVELLTIHYKGFNNLIKKAAQWKTTTAIGTAKDVACLNEAKKVSPLIIIDPVDSTRNAAAAINEEKYNQFITICKKYLKTKNKAPFFMTPLFNLTTIKKRYNTIFTLTADEGKKDVIGAALRKTYEKTLYTLEHHEFKIIKKGWHWDEHQQAYFYFNIQTTTLPTTILLKGPPITMEDASKAFRKKHKKIYITKGRLIAEDQRNIRTIEQLHKKVLCKIIPHLGLLCDPSHSTSKTASTKGL